MIDASMDTSVETSYTKATRVAKPNLFYGDRDKLEDENVHYVDKACLVAFYMRGWAQAWVKPYLTKHLDPNNSEDAINRMFGDFIRFKDKVRQSFAVENEPLLAECAIQRLKQTNSA
jgi:hypothetical protein